MVTHTRVCACACECMYENNTDLWLSHSAMLVQMLSGLYSLVSCLNLWLLLVTKVQQQNFHYMHAMLRFAKYTPVPDAARCTEAWRYSVLFEILLAVQT